MQNIALVDAGPLIALFDKSDKYHQSAKRSIKKFRWDIQGKLISTWPIIAEAAYLLKERVHLEAQLDLLKWLTLGGVEIFDLTGDHLFRIIELQKKYSDLSMDFADATLLIVAETSNITKVFSIDKEFSIYRILGKRRFENLMK